MTKTLGQKIKELRIQKGFTQGELGGGKVTPSMISQIEADKANPSHRLLKWVSERLETPIEYFLTDMQLQSEKISSFRFAQALLEAGEPTQAIPILEQLTKEQSLPMYQHEIQQDLARCYRSAGRLQEAGETLEEVLSTAMLKRDTDTMLQILKEMGRIEQERHNYPLAIYHWNKANHIYKEADNANPYEWAELLKELAALHSYLGEYGQATTCYEQAMTLLAGTTDLRSIAEVYLNLSRLYRETSDYDRATQFAQHALSIFKSLNEVRISIQTKETFAALKAEEGQVREGILLLEECLEDYQKFGFIDRIGSVHGALANIHLLEQHFELARKHCQLALETVNDAAERATLYRTLAKVAKTQGNLQEAMDAAQRSVEFYAKANLPRDLAHAYAFLGELYKDSGDLFNALNALEKMRSAMEVNLKERGIVL
jgi:tetratricopeptide (TPR) repeat protein